MQIGGEFSRAYHGPMALRRDEDEERDIQEGESLTLATLSENPRKNAPTVLITGVMLLL
jgi:hypothetical protein